MTGKLTKTEYLLLGVAAVFLLAMGALYVRAAPGEGADYTITTRREAEPAAPEAEEPAAQPEEPAAPVDVNTAGLEALDALPGIGPVLAERIIAYREEHGPFMALEELLAVKGIGEATLEKLRPQATVGQAETVEAENTNSAEEKAA